LGGAIYVLGVTDNFSNCIWLLALPTKWTKFPPRLPYSRISQAFTPVSMAVVLSDQLLNLICHPNYVDVACRTMVFSLGYTAKLTAPYTHNQLTTMERQWASQVDSSTTMMQHATCPSRRHWSLAVRTTVYLRNRLRTHAASGSLRGVPYTLLHGVHVDILHLKVFGCYACLGLEGLRLIHGQSSPQNHSMYVHRVLRRRSGILDHEACDE
jgi:hypothetical protein